MTATLCVIAHFQQHLYNHVCATWLSPHALSAISQEHLYNDVSLAHLQQHLYNNVCAKRLSLPT